jgi:hypothetical protein
MDNRYKTQSDKTVIIILIILFKAGFPESDGLLKINEVSLEVN